MTAAVCDPVMNISDYIPLLPCVCFSCILALLPPSPLDEWSSLRPLLAGLISPLAVMAELISNLSFSKSFFFSQPGRVVTLLEDHEVSVRVKRGALGAKHGGVAGPWLQIKLDVPLGRGEGGPAQCFSQEFPEGLVKA